MSAGMGAGVGQVEGMGGYSRCAAEAETAGSSLEGTGFYPGSLGDCQNVSAMPHDGCRPEVRGRDRRAAGLRRGSTFSSRMSGYVDRVHGITARPPARWS